MLCLRPEMVLRPADGYVEMINTADSRTPVFHLHPLTAVVLALCDGKRTNLEIVRIGSHIFDLPELTVAETLAGASRRFRMFMQKDQVREPIDLEPLIFPSTYTMDRYEAPIAFTWVVTGHCDKGCVYCYQAAKRSTAAPDATLSYERVLELVDEAAAIGVSAIKLSGGEPFLRPDLFDIIGYTIRKGIDVKILTKWSFTPEEAQRLVATGLKEITISLDSIDEETSDLLVASRGYTRQAMATIQTLVDAGVDVIVNTVVCATNFDSLERSIAAWKEMGVKRITVAEYWESAGRAPSFLKLPKPQLDQLVELVERHKNDPVCPLEFGTECDSLVDMHNCAHGLNTLAVLPDGSVSRCEHIPVSVPEIIVGDLKTQSIMEVWNSPRYLGLIFPEEELYKGTACHGCDSFQGCHSNGRCLMVPLVRQNTLFGPSCNMSLIQLDEEVL